jgi:predicted PurR-regulated permease PerM
MLAKGQLYFFFAFLILIGILAFFLALPYLQAIVLAAAMAVECYPLYERLLKLLRFNSIAAVMVIVLLALVIFTPLAFVGFQVVQEATNLYFTVGTNGLADLQANPFVASFLNRFSPDALTQSQDVLQNVLGWLIGSAGSFFGQTVILFLNTLICIFALFYFLRDGRHLRDWIIAFNPLPKKYDEMILERLKNTVNSVVRGNLVVALMHGLWAGVGLAVAGVPNPALWGSLAAIVALVPAVGPSLIYVPAIVYLFLQGHPVIAIALWVWWLLAILVVDNITSPRLVNRGVRIHPFTVFIAVIGGITFFGPVGFLIGPLIFSLFFTLLDIYISFHNPDESP